ncbi:ATP-dependent DNA helicase, RecQ family [Desulfotomaculum arcticum]|uniref:DNA 3'-5' helicase n=1 Tax=Desulfotruncus arcticus DSM 17038 TaxID=1121424 RepID=A0A1I2ML94_9FIRM|nr:DEAD/DEAH box helicase [Desulfotruncus arcticus]SFF92223.1 ATP-dependent DNA helicase, RecQ family [Desulfotomaculum arcticum] [Desulfotruncus arcticus DSM 17038]
MNAIIEQKVLNTLERISNMSKQVLVFLRGFPCSVYERLKKQRIPCLSNPKWINDNGYINVIMLTEHNRQLMKAFLTIDDTIPLVWGYYEEFIALTTSINELNKQFDGDIVILDNNLFDKYYPLDIPTCLLKKLKTFYNSDITDVDSDVEALSNFYSDVVEFRDGLYGLAFINRHDEESIPVYGYLEPQEYITYSPLRENCMSYPTHDDVLFPIKENLQQGRALPEMQIVVDGERDTKKIALIISALQMMGVPFTIARNTRFVNLNDYERDTYLPILKKYWGEDNSFRLLDFYKNPDKSNELIKISQGHIISDIVQQSMRAVKNQGGFNDIVITAPTGAGKSVLFQIPAIYMAQEHQAVTLVITPLIALMRDQVEQLNARGIDFATFINSEISFEEKNQRIEGIKNGHYSIVYLSPELFLVNALESMIGPRRLRLLVVDEVHLVTTWGRDFRADYWYLGGYIDKLRSQRLSKTETVFPVLCLTATAVYGGKEDMVEDTIRSLSLSNPKLYIGNVKRKNIGFDIRFHQKVVGGHDDFKLLKTQNIINSCIKHQKKCIVYCPYTSQVEDVVDSFDDVSKSRVGKYYGGFDKYEKIDSQNNFKNGQYFVMVCTKAFGMGVDIPNIEQVYHYAPTGNLADYVQEIGRAARDPKINGIAVTDFTIKDMKYVRMLYGLSGMRQYQLREMIRKIYAIYREKKHRHLLISPEAFSYLFKENELENKVKSGMLLIAKDLEEIYTFPVLNVRPRGLFTKNYVNVPYEIEEEFLQRFGCYIQRVDDDMKRVIPCANKHCSDVVVYNSGAVYEMNMASLWEEQFNKLTFAQFKRKFFDGELFQFDNGQRPTARVNLIINYEEKYETVSEKLDDCMEKLISIFQYFKSQARTFTRFEFREQFKEILGEQYKSQELPKIILGLFIADISHNVGFNCNADRMKFIQARKAHNSDEMVYRIMNSNFNMIKRHFSRLLEQCLPNNESGRFATYIPVAHNDKLPELINLAIFLELLGLATYEIIGGKNTEIFLRINDPNKLRRALQGSYSNNILTDIERKHEYSQKILVEFMKNKFSDEERWDIIEDYFLGRDEIVKFRLGIQQ